MKVKIKAETDNGNYSYNLFLAFLLYAFASRQHVAYKKHKIKLSRSNNEYPPLYDNYNKVNIAKGGTA